MTTLFCYFIVYVSTFNVSFVNHGPTCGLSVSSFTTTGMLRKWQAREGDKGSGEIQSNILTSRFIRAAPHNYNASDKNIGPRSPAISTDGPTCQWQHAKKVTPRNCISAALLKTNDRRRTQVTIQWVEEEKNSADEMCCGCQSVRMEIQRWRRYFGNTMETDAS